jgi:DNA gyrase subunit B
MGCGIGEEFEPERLRYHKIIIMTDADVDGSHIQTLLLTFFFRFLAPVIENGYVYLAQPPLYRFKKGKKEIYLKDEKSLNDYLIETGIEGIELEAIGARDMVEYLKIISAYRNILKELEKRFSVIGAVRYMIENPDIISKPMNEIFEIIKTYLDGEGYNLLNHVITQESIHLYVQTSDGLEELVIDDILFTSPLYQEALYIYDKMKERDMSVFGDEDPIDVLIRVEKYAKKGAYVQRYKGLGEMNPEQLWETTMSPENRRLLQVKIEDAQSASDTFSLFMGDEVEPRRQYIQDHAKDVKHLDV